MPTRILPGHRNLLIPINIRASGDADLIVESDKPVSTYIFDEEGRDEFYKEGDDSNSYGGFKNRRRHLISAELPKGRYYLVILNPGDSSTAVHYETTRRWAMPDRVAWRKDKPCV